jgi:hypothetical protein
MAAVDHAGAKATLASVIHLHSLNLVRKNVAWYLINECISPEAAAALDDQNDAAVKAFVPHMNTALESLGLPDIEQLHSPIVRDFQAFNAQNDFENFDAAGPLFDFRTTGTMQQAKL